MFGVTSEMVILIIVSVVRFVWLDVSMVVALLLQVLLPTIVCCLAIHYLRRLLMRWISAAFGWPGVLGVSWLGTPIHELSHFFFIVLSGMSVTKLALFEPNKDTGGLGYVKFSYSPRNLVHQIGCFLSAIAPLIGGSAAIYLVTVLLLPGFALAQPAVAVPFFQPADVLEWQRAELVMRQLVDFDMAIFRQLVNGLSLSDWRTYAYIYFVFSVAHNMSPSGQDLIGFPKRMAYVVAVLVVLNAPLLLLGLGGGEFHGKVLLPPIVDLMTKVTSILYLGVFVSFAAVAVSFPITLIARAFRR